MKIKSIYILFIKLFLVSGLYSALLFDMPCQVVQPNGIIIDAFRSGDEFHNWYHDADGYTIVHYEKSGYWCWAKVENGELISTGFPIHQFSPHSLGIEPRINISEQRYIEKRSLWEKQRLHPNGGTPSVGIIQSILIFIRFDGESEFEQTKEHYHIMFNDTTPGASSVHNVFLKESYGSFKIYTNFYPMPTETMVISYQDIYPRDHFRPYPFPGGYTGGEYGEERKQREHQLLKRAINYVADQIPSSLIIDSDNDGNVDHMNFIIRGTPNNWNELIWAHQGVLNTDDVYIHGKKVHAYNFNIEASTYVGVLCHEIGHSLGMPDLYRHSGSAAPLSFWDMMSMNTDIISTYMKYAYTNWISSAETKYERISEIPVISSSGDYSLNRATNPTNNIYRINSPNSEEEFFVIEYTVGLTNHHDYFNAGLLVFRVNPSLYGNIAGPPDELWVYRPSYLGDSYPGSIEAANFTSSLSRTAINDFTNPPSLLSDGRLGGLNIYDIGENKSETISFKVDTSAIKIHDIVSKNSYFTLFPAFPNPFNPETTISYYLKFDSFVSIDIFNIKGQKIKTLINDFKTSGHHLIVWNGKDDNDHDTASGIYFYKMKANEFIETNKMILLK